MRVANSCFCEMGSVGWDGDIAAVEQGPWNYFSLNCVQNIRKPALWIVCGSSN